MTKETYEKAEMFIKDINAITLQIEEVEKYNHWITTSTPNHRDVTVSLRFQKDLVNCLKQMREQYQKEFDDLD